MATLSNAKKEEIISNVIDCTLKKKQDELQASSKGLALAIYRYYVSEETEAILDSLPPGFMKKETRIQYRDVENNYSALYLEEARRIPYTLESWAFHSVGTSIEPLDIAHQTLKREYVNLKDELKSKLKQIMASVRTDRQLESIWPEGRQFYMGLLDKGGQLHLPAVVTESLNTLIDTIVHEE